MHVGESSRESDCREQCQNERARQSVIRIVSNSKKSKKQKKNKSFQEKRSLSARKSPLVLSRFFHGYFSLSLFPSQVLSLAAHVFVIYSATSRMPCPLASYLV